MAIQNNIAIGIQVEDRAKTLSKRLSEAVKLRQELEAANAAANGFGSTSTAGSRRAMTAATGTDSSGRDYNTNRGAAGITGASARDFANQSQGLGGLVRLYATYAANIFAVGAAFTALSRAADTTNMVRGMDQLGAASGIALGSLSKRLVETTDGAISLREAMEATVKASSAGMNSDQILRMGKVAQQASVALGVNMSDAISRISRGITKLEPELLDEIGIFTKTGKAAEEYAKSVGKTASQLTDFERRQAFANAVIAEGESKFGKIDSEQNSYTKLAASVANLQQKGLELVNAFLVPAVELLSRSPSALGAAFAAIGVTIIKQALPAIGQFKAGLAQAAEQAREFSNAKAAAAEDALSQLNVLAQNRKDTVWQTGIAEADEYEAKLRQLQPKVTKNLQAMFDANHVDDYSNALQKANTHLRSLRQSLTRAERSGQDDAIIGNYRERIAATEGWINSMQAAYTAASTINENDIELMHANAAATRVQNLAREANIAQIKQSIVANAAHNASLVGFRGAMALAADQIQNSGLQLTAFQRTTVLARSGVAAITQRIGGMISSLGGVMQGIGIAIAAFTLLDGVLSKTSKQQSEFNQALEGTEDAFTSLEKTIGYIKDKPLEEQFSTAQVLAFGTAVSEVTVSLSKLMSTYQRVSAATKDSWWDSLKDGVAQIFGKSNAQEFASQFSTSLIEAIKLMGNSPETKELRKTISSITGLSNTFSEEELRKHIRSLKEGSAEYKALKNALDAAGIQMQKNGQLMSDFDNATKATVEAARAFNQEFTKSDTFTTFGTTLIAQAGKLSSELGNASRGAKQLLDILASEKSVSIYNQEDLLLLEQNKKGLQDTITEINKLQEAADKAERSAEDLQKRLDAIRTRAKNDPYNINKSSTDTDIANTDPIFKQTQEQLRQAVARAEKLRAEAQQLEAKSLETVGNITSAIQFSTFEKGTQILMKSMEAGAGKIGSALRGVIDSVIGNLPGMAQERAKQENAIINTQIALIEAQKANTIATKENTAVQALAIAKKDLELATSYQTSQSDAESARLGIPSKSTAEKNVREAEAKLEVLKKLSQGGASQIKSLEEAVRNGTVALGKDTDAYVDYINSITSFNIKIAELKDQQAANTLKGQLNEIQNAQIEESKMLSTASARNELDRNNLEIQYKQKLITEEQYNKELLSIDIKSRQLALDSEVSKLAADRAALQTVIDSNASSAEQKSAARRQQEIIDEQILLAIAGTQLKIKADIVAKEERGLSLARKRQDTEIELIKILREGYHDQLRFADEKTALDIEILELKGEASDYEISNQKYLLELSKEQTKLIIDRNNLTDKYNASVLKVNREIATENDDQTKELLKKQLEALKLNYESELAYLDIVYNKRIEILNLKQEESNMGWLLDGLTDTIITAFTDGGKAAMSQLKQSIGQAVKDSISKQLRSEIKSIFTGKNTSFANGLSSLLAGDFSAAGQSILSAVTSLSSVFQPNGFIADKLMSLADDLLLYGMDGLSASIQGFSAGLREGGAALLKEGSLTGAQLAGQIVGGILDGMAALSISKLLSGGYKVGNGVIVDIATTIAGFFFGPIAGVIAGIFNRAFGRKLADQGIEGVFNVKEGFEGRMYQFYKGGWFSSDKTKYSEMDRRMSDMIGDQISAVLSSSRDAAAKLGLSFSNIESIYDNYTTDVKISLQGKDTEEKVQKAFEDYFKGISDELATQALNALIEQEAIQKSIEFTDEYLSERLYSLQQAGETSQDTLARLQTALTTVNTQLYMLGQSMLDVSLVGAEYANSLVNLFGGIEEFNKSTNSYYNNFYSEEERTAKSIERLQTALSILGYEMPSSIDGFRELVDAQDLTTESGRVTYAALIQLSSQFYEVTAGANSAAAQLAAAAQSLSEAQSWAAGMAESAGGSIFDPKSYEQDSTGLDSGNSQSNAVDKSLSELRQAREAIMSFVEDILTGVSNLLPKTAETFKQVATAYKTQLGLAMGGDLEATKNLAQTSRTYLERQVGLSATSTDARRASMLMALELKKLPAVPEDTLQDTMKKVDKQINILNESMLRLVKQIDALITDIQQTEMSDSAYIAFEKAVTQLKDATEAVWNANISDLIKVKGINTLGLVSDTLRVGVKAEYFDDGMKELVASSGEEISRAIKVTVESLQDDDTISMMLSTTDDITKTFNILVTNQNIDPAVRALALSSNKDLATTIAVSMSTRGMSKEDVVSVSNLVKDQDRVISLTVDSSKLSIEDKELILGTAIPSTNKTIQLAISDFTGEDKDIILEATQGSVKTIELAIKSGDPEAVKLATAESSAINTIVSAQTGPLSPEVRALLQDGTIEQKVQLQAELLAADAEVDITNLAQPRALVIAAEIETNPEVESAIAEYSKARTIGLSALLDPGNTEAEIAQLQEDREVFIQALLDAGATEEQIAKLTEQTTLDIEAILDTANALDVLAGLTDQENVVSIDVEADTSGVDAALDDAAGDRTTTIVAEADTTAASVALDSVAEDRETTIIAVADTSAAQSALDAAAAPRSAVITVDVQYNVQEMPALPAGAVVDGQHALGLYRVPFDGYIAELHEGERVLTSEEASKYNQVQRTQWTPGSENGQEALVNEIKALREEVTMLRAEARATASHTAKAARILDRVSPDGATLQVAAVV